MPTIISENYIFSEKDIQVNMDDFYNGKSHLLFITGLAGSGKSTESLSISKSTNAVVIQLDYLYYIMAKIKNVHEENVEKNKLIAIGNKILEDFVVRYVNNLKIDKNNIDIFFDEDSPGENPMQKLIKAFVKYMINNYNNTSTYYIIEGIHILFIDYSNIENLPFILKGASVLRALYRRYKDLTKDSSQNFNVLYQIKWAIGILKWYNNFEKRIRKYKKEIKQS